MLYACRDHKTIASLHLQGRLAIHQDFSLALHDVADLVARMCVSARKASRRDFNSRDHRFTAGHRNVFTCYDRALNGRGLREKHTGCYKE